MKTFSLTARPDGLKPYRKKAPVEMVLVTEPFTVETQEGPMHISPQTVDDWDGGYYVAFPSDGSKPYSIAPRYVRDNYVQIDEDDE